jgi:ABC-type transporter Mla subunit MlaD
MHCERCGHNNGDRDLIVVLAREVTIPVLRAVARLEGLIHNEGDTIMSELDDNLAQVKTALDAHDAELSRLITDFGNSVAGKLNDSEKQQFADIVNKLAAQDAVIEQTDPSAPQT